MKYFLPVICSLLLIGCGDSAEAPATAQTPSAAEAVATPAEQPAAPEATAEAAAPEVAVAEAVAEPASVAPETPKAAPETPKAAPAKAAAAVPSAAVDGTALFGQKCASCHGMKAEKAALGKSQVIAGWSAQQVKDALKGYQSGTYGKEMKALMQGQAKGLSDAQIDALAAHISGL